MYIFSSKLLTGLQEILDAIKPPEVRPDYLNFKNTTNINQQCFGMLIQEDLDASIEMGTYLISTYQASSVITKQCLTIVKWKHDNFEIIKSYIVPFSENSDVKSSAYSVVY